MGYAIATAAVLSGIVASLGALEAGLGAHLGRQGVEVNQPLPDVNEPPSSLPFHDDEDDWTGVTTPEEENEGTSGQGTGTVNGGSDDGTTTTTAAPTTSTTAPVADVTFENVYQGRVGIQHSNKCLRVKNNGQVVQQGCNNNSNRQVTINQASDDGSFVLQMGGECLAPANDSLGQGAEIWAESCDPNDATQRWTRDGDRFINAASGRCLDVYGGSTGNNAKLIQWSCHGGGNQNFPLTDGSLGGGNDPVLQVSAANATLQGDMASSTVDGRAAIGTSNRGRANYSSANNTNSKATFTFTVTERGTYAVVGNVIAPDHVSDSFWVQVNGNPSSGTAWHIPNTTTWAPRTATQVFLEPGEHTVVLSWREDGTWIDGLELVKQ